MSKMKRKWLRVIEYEETGRPLDEITRESLLETHPDLPILQDAAAMPVAESIELPDGYHDVAEEGVITQGAPEAMMLRQPESQIDSQLDAQLQQQIQREIASAEPSRA